MKNNKKFSLVLAGIGIVFVLLYSLLSLTKLMGLMDDNSIALRIVNRDIIILSLAVFSIVVYLWRKD